MSSPSDEDKALFENIRKQQLIKNTSSFVNGTATQQLIKNTSSFINGTVTQQLIKNTSSLANSFSGSLATSEFMKSNFVNQQAFKALEASQSIAGSLAVSETMKSVVTIQQVLKKSIKPHQSIELFVSKAEKIEEIFKNLEKLDLQKFLDELAKIEWYLHIDEMPLPILSALSVAFQYKDIEKVNRIIIQYLRKNIDSIQYEIINSYPERQDALSEAFQAHKQGMYYSSISNLFTQVDGICKTRSGKYLFIRSDRTEFAKRQPKSSDIRLLLSNNLAPLWISHQRPANFRGLNRHLVIHGESTDHGSEINSLKVISLLYFIHRLI